MERNPIIEFTNFTFKYFAQSKPTIKNLNLKIYEGEKILIVGPSGSGKSILMNSILSSLGGASCEAALCESSVTWDIDADETGIENDDVNVFKHIKKEKSRYFVNNQSLSRKAIGSVASKYLRHLSLKDFSDFENANLLNILAKKKKNSAHEGGCI